MNQIPVAVLGATGTVGQKFVTLLHNHPQFRITELVASPRSAGKPYREACNWKQPGLIPEDYATLVVKSIEEPLSSQILFSGLDSSVAGEAESRYAEAGHVVISNSKNHRMDADVPLIIPEINSAHFALVKRQTHTGVLITNSNCSTMFLAMALAPLNEEFGIEAVQVTTLQAISGAGYPGVPSMDIMGNVVPYIGDEEDKLETETAKILGTLTDTGLEFAQFTVSATCTRVPVFDGHTESVSIKFKRTPSVDEVKRCLSGFRGPVELQDLPSAPRQPIVVLEEDDRPQPLRDLWLENGMATVVGRVRPCPVMDVKMVLLGHNTVRGAAGAAILNAEAFVKLGYFGS